jgi:hypothetical protein
MSMRTLGQVLEALLLLLSIEAVLLAVLLGMSMRTLGQVPIALVADCGELLLWLSTEAVPRDPWRFNTRMKATSIRR